MIVLLLAIFHICSTWTGHFSVQQSSIAQDSGPLGMPSAVVEEVAPHSEGEKAGLEKGDLLLSWSGNGSKGEIRSPFDLVEIEIEHAPRGIVKVAGLRGTEKKTWVLGSSPWGLMARPDFTGDILVRFMEGEKRAKTGEATEALQASVFWNKLAHQPSVAQIAWLPAWLLFHSAEQLRKEKQWKEADDTYQDAVQCSSSLSSFIQAQLLQSWGQAYQDRSDWINAEKYVQKAIASIEHADGDRFSIALSLEALGRVSLTRGDVNRASEYHHRALEIREQLAPESLPVASSVNDLGRVAYYRGDMVQANELFRQSLSIWEKVSPGNPAAAGVLNNLASVASRQGDLTNAEFYYRKALDAQTILAPQGIPSATTLNNLGNIAYQRGDWTKAEALYRESLNIEGKLEAGSLGEARTLSNLGALAKDRGDLVQAEQYLGTALQIKEKLSPESHSVVDSLGNLGDLAAQQGDLAKAEQYYRRAIEIQQKTAPGSFWVAELLNSLGDVAVEQTDFAKAEKYLEEARAIQEKLAPKSLDLAQVFNSLGRAAFQGGDLRKSEQYYHQALTVEEVLEQESLPISRTRQALGDLARASHDLRGAEQYYRQALAIVEKLAPGSEQHAGLLDGLASILRDQGDLGSASHYYTQAIRALEKQTSRLGGSEDLRTGFRAKYSEIYKHYIDLLLQQKQYSQALGVLEQSRARNLIEMLSVARIEIHKGADPSLLEQEHSLQESLAAKSTGRLRLLEATNNEKQVAIFTKELEDLEKQYQAIEDRLRQASPGYTALTQPQPLTTDEIQGLLDGDTLLLEYSLGSERSHVFVVTSQSIAVHELPKRVAVENEAKLFHELLTARNRSIRGESFQAQQLRISKADIASQAVASRLSHLLLDPVALDLRKNRLLIVGDGALQYLPFSALPAPQNASGTAPKMNRPLIAENEILELPSASVLAVLRRERTVRNPPSKQVAALADPVFDSQDPRVNRQAEADSNSGDIGRTAKSDSIRQLTRSLADAQTDQDGPFFLARLPFSRREAAASVFSAPPDMSLEAVDFDANRELAISGELAHYRVVHFATHALVDDRHPELSGLVLSLVDRNGSPREGFLDLRDIYNLDLSADLVVLSACDTALGKQVDGEGLIGLTRGFMYAGAGSVLGTQWKVEDFATAKLMQIFYREMNQHGMPPAQALRQAQLALWHERHWSAPYYWAGFVFQGDWK
ncbi:MAG TPA: CHAT domain-containing protein [Candidatus Angelobacter sp.]|nr:CHAT domain-containing protein [Candidatus Angelobacter sp.]